LPDIRSVGDYKTGGIVKTEDDSNVMTDSMRQDWSRHYDTLQWGVIAIFIAGIAALVGASFGQDNKESPWPEVAGYILVMLGVFFAASFRSFRARLHSGIKNKELQDFLIGLGQRRPYWPHQWDVYVLSLLAVGILFVFRLAGKIGHFRIVLPSGLIVLIILLGACWVKGRSEG
jgi:hypothetical protein